jgi:hypothetical protein
LQRIDRIGLLLEDDDLILRDALGFRESLLDVSSNDSEAGIRPTES